MNGAGFTALLRESRLADEDGTFTWYTIFQHLGGTGGPMATQQSNPPTALGPPRGLRAVVVGNIIGGLVVAGLCTGGTRAGSLHQAVR